MPSSFIEKRAAASLLQEYRDRRRRESRKPILHGDGTVEFPPIEGFKGRLVTIRVHADLAGIDDRELDLCTCCEHSDETNESISSRTGEEHNSW